VDFTSCPFLDFFQYHDTIDFINMPVTIQSQTKLLTGSTTKLSTVFLTGSHELWDSSTRSPQKKGFKCFFFFNSNASATILSFGIT